MIAQGPPRPQARRQTAPLTFAAVWLAVLLVLTGCQPIQRPVATSEQAGGQLAYIGGDGNVYVTAAARTTAIAITADATVEAEGNGRSYHRLAWSPDGKLAFAAVERGFGATYSELLIAKPGEAPRRISEHDGNFIIYLHWSPKACPAASCAQLAYLIGGEQAIDLHLVEMKGQQVDDRVVGAGEPFYFSWSADGGQMLWHQSGSRRFHPDASLTLFDVNERRAQVLAAAPGYFLAPAWSPDGSYWLDVVEGDAGMVLRLVNAATQHVTVLAESEYDIAFVWAPDGQSVAYAVRRYATDPFFGPLHVYDLQKAESRRITDNGLHVQAFFWSPDGTRLAYIHWLGLPAESWAQWRVYNLVTDQDRGYNAFNPSFQMRLLIGSFNQFAQSHRLWSPDGRYLTYADRDRGLVERVWLVDTYAAKGAPPILVDQGSFAVWSWR